MCQDLITIVVPHFHIIIYFFGHKFLNTIFDYHFVATRNIRV